MKIAVIGQFDWYGCMGEWVARGFEYLDDKVYRIDRKNIEIVDNPDILFFVDCSEDYSGRIPDIDKPKIFWSMDTHMPFGAERSINISKKMDIVLSSNYEYGKVILKKFGIDSYLLPITYNPEFPQRKTFVDAKIDICMIGHQNSPERSELWKMLSKYKSFCGKAEDENKYCDLMNSCKIVVNQPTEPFDMILNNRFFEALAFKKILLQKRLNTSLIEKMGFVAGVDFEYWSTFDELQVLINNHLAHFSSKVNISKELEMMNRGHQKVLQYSIPLQLNFVKNLILDKFYEL